MVLKSGPFSLDSSQRAEQTAWAGRSSANDHSTRSPLFGLREKVIKDDARGNDDGDDEEAKNHDEHEDEEAK